MNSNQWQDEIDRVARAEAGAIARRYRIDGAEADDLVQEAALGMLQRGSRLDASRPPSERRAYLGKIARSAALDYLRWRGRRTNSEVPGVDERPWLAPSVPSAEAEVEAIEAARNLADLIDGAGLTDREREALLGPFGLAPTTEAFAHLAPGTRSGHAFRARAKLIKAREVDGCKVESSGGVFGGFFGR
jgi:RNA polymerase sigma factor (sigma-70 family)